MKLFGKILSASIAALAFSAAGVTSANAAVAGTQGGPAWEGCVPGNVHIYFDVGDNCYGGTPGSMHVEFFPARGGFSGAYWGFITCSDGSQRLFSPNQSFTIGCDVTWVGITKPNWEGF
ncbi:hypothetical protein [Kribbella sp. DT2]|uniref:hypothetical protein n=1 Tax=Kribbella sp. DT2 TaxID=3393427 RepID=UPI003CF395F6